MSTPGWQRPTSRSAAVTLINPLPSTLAHYQSELSWLVVECGHAVNVSLTPQVEMTMSSPASRSRRAAHLLRDRLGNAASGTPRIVVWPALGLLDAATWIRGRHATWLIVHDPEPLRRQFGMGRISTAAGRWASMRGVGIIAHTDVAADVLRAQGWQVTVLPHPIRPADQFTSRPGSQLTVIGQWKPVRRVEPLSMLAGDTTWEGRRELVGAGWPPVEGWSLDSRFLSELELDACIDRAACVVVPYTHYFQSGVAIRCLERATPVVGTPHPFLTAVFGSDWPGVVTDDDWVGAVRRASAVSREEMMARCAAYRRTCVDQWREFLNDVVSSAKTTASH